MDKTNTDDAVALVRNALWKEFSAGAIVLDDAQTTVRGLFDRLAKAAIAAMGGDHVREDWQPIETAPKDGTRILGLTRNSCDYGGRHFEIRHEGVLDGHDLGWALFPGFGGVPDRWFKGWMPLPAPPQSQGER